MAGDSGAAWVTGLILGSSPRTVKAGFEWGHFPNAIVLHSDSTLGSRSQAVIRTSYDPEADVLHVSFGPADANYDGAAEVAPGVFVEFDADGNAIGVEVLSVKPRAAGTYGRGVKAAAE